MQIRVVLVPAHDLSSKLKNKNQKKNGNQWFHVISESFLTDE